LKVVLSDSEKIKDVSSRSEEEEKVEPEVLEAEAEILPAEVEDNLVLPVEVEAVESPEVMPESLESNSTALTHYDALSIYLKEVKAIPRLSIEEELSLTKKYFEEKDLKAAYRLVQSNLWLVVKIAREYSHAVRSLLDLVQEGNIGLMEAVKNFNPYKGARLPSYATWWIRAYIVRYLIANWRLVKLGTTQAQRKLFFNLHKEKEKLEREGFRPEPKLLAEKLNVKESEVVEMQQRLGAPDLSVDAPLAGDSDYTMHSVLSADGHSMEDAMAVEQLRDLIAKAIADFESTLREKDRIIFKKRLLSEEKATLQELSDELGISRERVRQIEVRLIERFKEFVHNNFDPDVLQQFEFLVS
jgi:RNA polymerase sigma-32 factor